MAIVLKAIFGSWLYGTNVETSDRDIKIIYIPNSDDIILQRANQVPKEDLHVGPEKDVEYISLHKFIHLLCSGQTMALDLLFAPESFIIQKSQDWDFIVANKDKFVNKGIAAFHGYAKAQANKYCKKGQRYNEVKKLIALLETRFAGRDGLRISHVLCQGDLDGFEHIKFCMINGANNTQEPALNILGKEFALHHRKEYILQEVQRIVDEYGKRSINAAEFGEKDWKALYHSVRIGEEAKELLTTGMISFPRPEAPLLLDIRQGKLELKTVADMIDVNLALIDELMKTSSLPDAPNLKFAEGLIYNTYASNIFHYHTMD